MLTLKFVNITIMFSVLQKYLNPRLSLKLNNKESNYALVNISILLVSLFAGFAAYKNWQSKAPMKSGSKYIKIAKQGRENFNILIVGDTGTGNDNQFSVAKAIDKYCKNNKLDFVIMLGDNFYQAGVRSITDLQWQTKWQCVLDQLPKI